MAGVLVATLAAIITIHAAGLSWRTCVQTQAADSLRRLVGAEPVHGGLREEWVGPVNLPQNMLLGWRFTVIAGNGWRSVPPCEEREGDVDRIPLGARLNPAERSTFGCLAGRIRCQSARRSLAFCAVMSLSTRRRAESS